MTEEELREKLRIIGMSQKSIIEHIELYYSMKKKVDPNFSFEELFELAKKSYEEAERSKGSVTLDGDL